MKSQMVSYETSVTVSYEMSNCFLWNVWFIPMKDLTVSYEISNPGTDRLERGEGGSFDATLYLYPPPTPNP